jgi:UDP-glucose 4-epimerase
MRARRVVISGGAGFIGSHLAERLLALGSEVRVVDDLSTGRRENLPPGAELVVASVADPAVWSDVLDGVDAVAHLAAIASVERSVEDPVGTNAVNLRATVGLADAAARHGVRRLVYASSAAVYGAVGRERQAEDAPVDPLTPYAIDKYAGERYLDAYRRRGVLDARSLRFFNVYGPRQDPASPYSGVIGIFAKRLLAGRPLAVFGDGRQTRDFVFVGDVVDVIVDHLRDASDDAPVPMNVGTERSVSLLDLIAALEDVLGVRAEVEHRPEREGDIRHSASDCGRLRAWRGAAATTELSEGLAATVAWLRSDSSAPAGG